MKNKQDNTHPTALVRNSVRSMLSSGEGTVGMVNWWWKGSVSPVLKEACMVKIGRPSCIALMLRLLYTLPSRVRSTVYKMGSFTLPERKVQCISLKLKMAEIKILL